MSSKALTQGILVVFDDDTQTLQIKGRHVHGGIENYGDDGYEVQFAGPIPEPREPTS